MRGGRLAVESEVGRGSTFHFTTWFEVPAGPTWGPLPSTAAGSDRCDIGPQRLLRILLAEDNPINQKLAVSILVKQGHTVVVAGNGREALAALDKQTFDAVLMDVQ